jgi:peroxiredoxin
VLVGIALVVVAIVAAVTVVVISDNETTSSPTTAKGAAKASIEGVATVGEQAPDFELKTLDGKTVRLSDYAGKPVVVNFWASYCHPCREEFPMFRQALEQHHNDFVLLGVDYRDIASDARKFAKDKRATWPILEDPGDQVALAYGVRAVPQTFFIGRDGKISQRYYAQVPDDLFEQELAKISKPAAVTTTTTTPPR